MLSCITIMLVMAYAGFKLTSLVALADFDVKERNQHAYYQPSDIFGRKEHFNVAVAFIQWDYKDHVIEDPTIGEIKFMMKSWGNEAGDPFTELETTYCDESGFEGIDDKEFNKTSGANFYPISPLFAAQLKMYRRRFKCLAYPERDLSMFGNYHTEVAANLMVVFDKCNNATSTVTCKSPEAISEYLEFKYLLGLWNTNQFV